MADYRKIKWYQTIRTKLITILVFTTSVVLIALAYAYYNYIETTKFEELSELTDVSAIRLSKHLIIPMWTLDREQIDELVQTEMEEQRIAGIVIRDKDQRTLFMAKERNAGGQIVDSVGTITGDLFSTDRAVIKDGKKIATVSVYVTKQFTKNELREFGLGVVLTVFILNIAIFFTMMFAISRLIILPLENLTNVAVKISRGEINQVIYIDSSDEIGILAVAFQKMQISLKVMMKRASR